MLGTENRNPSSSLFILRMHVFVIVIVIVVWVWALGLPGTEKRGLGWENFERFDIL